MTHRGQTGDISEEALEGVPYHVPYHVPYARGLSVTLYYPALYPFFSLRSDPSYLRPRQSLSPPSEGRGREKGEVEGRGELKSLRGQRTEDRSVGPTHCPLSRRGAEEIRKLLRRGLAGGGHIGIEEASPSKQSEGRRRLRRGAREGGLPSLPSGSELRGESRGPYQRLGSGLTLTVCKASAC